jgi:hypothetical protein
MCARAIKLHSVAAFHLQPAGSSELEEKLPKTVFHALRRRFADRRSARTTSELATTQPDLAKSSD